MIAAADIDEATARLNALAKQVRLRVLVVPTDEPHMRYGTSHPAARPATDRHPHQPLLPRLRADYRANLTR